MNTALKKVNDNLYTIDGIFIHRSDKVWKYTMDVIENERRRAKNPGEFKKKMATRLHRLKNKQKIYYTIAYFKDIGDDYLSEMYDAKIITDKLLEM